MNKIITYFMALALIFLGTASLAHASKPTMDIAQAIQAPSVDSGSSSTGPSTDTTGSASTGPSTDTTGSSSASPVGPSVDAHGSSSAASPTATPTPTQTPTPTGSSGSTSSTSSGGSSSSSSSGGGGTYVGIPSCELITSYVTVGGANKTADVTRLQLFLKNHEGATLTVTGTYDAATIAAVKAFQVKYSDTILAPWGVTSPSGDVYITTLKKINQLACSAPLNLNAAEAAEIMAYKNHTPAPASATVSPTVTAPATTTMGPSPVTPSETNPVVGTTNTNGTSNTATVANTSIFHRFWYFLKNLF